MEKAQATEHRLTKMETILKAITTNDLPHIRTDIKALRTRMAWIQGTIILALLGIIANLVV
ncbi:hypothetical protein LCGC14_2684190 [marine sediment metagenome]|uniref:Hemolysin XhlA n=1 Tax=marine sediment metagenome TaxID=412755 RepID=A0A0F9CC58_9ZZZZ